MPGINTNLLRTRLSMLAELAVHEDYLGSFPPRGERDGVGVLGDVAMYQRLLAWAKNPKNEQALKAQAAKRKDPHTGEPVTFQRHKIETINRFNSALASAKREEQSTKKEIANLKKALVDFDAANPDLANLNEQDMEALLVGDNSETVPTRLATEQATQQEADEELNRIIEGTS